MSDAQDRAVKLAIGMTQDQVLALLGRPDETAARTYGSATPNPWTGVEWTYSWSIDAYNAKRLVIVFGQGKVNWLVNMWNWY